MLYKIGLLYEIRLLYDMGLLYEIGLLYAIDLLYQIDPIFIIYLLRVYEIGFHHRKPIFWSATNDHVLLHILPITYIGIPINIICFSTISSSDKNYFLVGLIVNRRKQKPDQTSIPPQIKS